LITTKSGAPKKGQKSLNVTYKTGYSLENISGIPEFQNTYGAGANFAVAGSNGSWGAKFGRGIIYGGGTINNVNGVGAPSATYIVGTSASGIDSIPAGTWATMYASYPELFPNGRLAYKANPENVSSLFNTGSLFENSIGLSGAREIHFLVLHYHVLTKKDILPIQATLKTISALVGRQTSASLQ
jgi:hypothetical protein